MLDAKMIIFSEVFSDFFEKWKNTWQMNFFQKFEDFWLTFAKTFEKIPSRIDAPARDLFKNDLFARREKFA